MTKIDRLGWAAGAVVIVYGVRIGIRTNDPAVLERLGAILPPASRPSSSPLVDRLYSLIVGGAGARPGVRRFHVLYGDAERLARTHDLEQALDRLEADIRLSISVLTRQRVMVHAGVVGWHGKAIVIPGRTYTGKTTLVAELVKAGATYYSDEYAVLDRRGRVHPFIKPLGIRDPATARQTPVAIESLGGSIGKKPLPVGLVVLAPYKAGARWRPRRLSPGRGALAMLGHTSVARRQPEATLAALHRAVASARVIAGPRGEAAEVAAAIRRSEIAGWRSP